jgi:hypothetical protein
MRDYVIAIETHLLNSRPMLWAGGRGLGGEGERGEGSVMFTLAVDITG